MVAALSSVAVTGRFSISLTLKNALYSLLTSSGNLDKPATFPCNCVGLNAIVQPNADKMIDHLYNLAAVGGGISFFGLKMTVKDL